MRRKVALLARVKNRKGWSFEPVSIEKGRPVEPDNATVYYVVLPSNLDSQDPVF